ncbi:MAG: hypothetical protein ACR2RE_18545 [Geminicoccaceae bacterium]
MVAIIWQALTAEWETFAVIALSVAVFAHLKAERPSWHAMAVFGIYFTSVVLMDLWRMVNVVIQGDKDLAYEIWGTSNHGTFVVASVVVFLFLLRPPKRDDMLAQLLCVILLVSAGWTALMENINCNFIQTDIPFDLQTQEQKEMSVCERLYGPWVTFAPIVVQLLAIGFYVKLWAKARRLTAS